MREVIVKLGGVVLLLMGLVYLNKYNNESYQTKCEAAGGTYLRSVDSSKSLCQLPK
jgi:hypothetical protein